MMGKKLIIFLIGFVLVLPLASVLLYTFLQPNTSFAFRQVLAIAPPEKNHQLSFGHHIRFSPRPEEIYPFPIALGEVGPTDSLYSGSRQYPFYCMTLDSKLGQPEIDNQQGYGVAVYEDIKLRHKIIGYSKDCSVKTQLSYFIISETNVITELKQASFNAAAKRGDNGILKATDKLFRVEHGTINRFIYTIVMPITLAEVDDRLAQSQWNKKLIYQFNGGSGIGYRQGRQTAQRVMARQIPQLLAGYAVISSSGNRTSYTYHMLLAEDTARRVKKQFVSLYSEPLYTVGIGGSGGGLAQYLIAQNSQGILDGLIPLYSYPDMITQTTYALDCDLLNNYFTFRAARKSTWQDWRKRQSIEGLNASNNFPQRSGYLQPINQMMSGFVPSFPTGNSECINGYFGLSSFINNPRQGFIRDFFHQDVVAQVKWSFWQDLSNVLGQDEQGFGLSTWDNVGVQYGLSALVAQQINIEEFLDLNRKVGAWKPQAEMVEESIFTPFGRKLPLWLSLWGNQNITEVMQNRANVKGSKVAQRHTGSIAAMKAAYRSGQVFIGEVSLPIIDVRHYLEEDLDMHHVSASFYSRLRILKRKGQADNHVIWISHKDYSPVNDAFVQMDLWLLAIKNQRGSSNLTTKPSALQDSCFAQDGSILYQGRASWDGHWNGKALGDCQKVYPMYSTSRIQAGGTWAGDLFKCQLMPVKQAIVKGHYGKIQMTLYLKQLQQIFPQGVCDYTKADVSRPANL